jgi:hypothetical protein
MRKDYKPLLKWALQAGQTVLWLIYGVAIVVLLSHLFGLFSFIAPLLTLISEWLWRLAVMVIVFVVTAILIEEVG